MDRNSRCRYQNNLPAAHRVFFNCPCQKSYGRKIRLPVTADTAGKSRQVTTRYGRKIRLLVTTETAGKSQQKQVEFFYIKDTRLQWRSGRTPGSQSEGRRFAPPLCSNNFPFHRRKIPVAQKTQHKIQAPMLKTFFALCTN
jgi:hypothetical protein